MRLRDFVVTNLHFCCMMIKMLEFFCNPLIAFIALVSVEILCCEC